MNFPTYDEFAQWVREQDSHGLPFMHKVHGYFKEKTHDWVSVHEALPPHLETVWLTNGKWVALGCRVEGEDGYHWADSNGVIYAEDGKIVAECESDDLDVTYWQRLPKLPVTNHDKFMTRKFRFRGMNVRKEYFYGHHHIVEVDGVEVHYIFWQGNSAPVIEDTVEVMTDSGEYRKLKDVKIVEAL